MQTSGGLGEVYVHKGLFENSDPSRMRAGRSRRARTKKGKPFGFADPNDGNGD